MSPDHHHTPGEEERIRDAALDETLEATFPASDPASSIPNPTIFDDALTGTPATTRPSDPDPLTAGPLLLIYPTISTGCRSLRAAAARSARCR